MDLTSDTLTRFPLATRPRPRRSCDDTDMLPAATVKQRTQDNINLEKIT